MDAHCDCCRRPTLDCLVLREFRLLKTPEGRETLRAEYQEALRARMAERDSRAAHEAWHWAQKMGAPYAALRTLKQGPQASAALTAARRFMADRAAVYLLLVGPTGVGKTVAAARVVLDFCTRWAWNDSATGTNLEPVRWIEAATLTRLSAYDHDAERFVGTLRDARLLVLEDVGDEGTKLGTGLLVELLMSRGNIGPARRTVITSNLSGQAFKARYGDAVADRIQAVGIVPNLHGEKSRRARMAS